jgi:carbon-monoxide dehydrogenase medium subunit
VLEGRVKLISTRGERTVLLADFFKGPNKTSMKPDEIMSEIQIPAIEKDAGNAFIKIARVAADISKISCAVAVVRKEDSCTECRIAMGAVAAVPLRIQSAESLLIGKKIDKSLLDRTAKALSAEIKPFTDVRSNEFYRRQVAQILFKDSFAKAWHRAGGKE